MWSTPPSFTIVVEVANVARQTVERSTELEEVTNELDVEANREVEREANREVEREANREVEREIARRSGEPLECCEPDAVQAALTSL